MLSVPDLKTRGRPHMVLHHFQKEIVIKSSTTTTWLT
jgi:hypothetical protein